MSMALALGPSIRLRTREVYADINHCRSWADKLILSAKSQMEPKVWLDSVDFLNGKPIWFSSGATQIVYSDASMTGYGGYMVKLGSDVAHGQWSAEEQIKLYMEGAKSRVFGPFVFCIKIIRPYC